jgi:hypothetical protein
MPTPAVPRLSSPLAVVTRRALAAGLVALLLGGCLSVRARRADGVPGDGGGVSLRVYADDDARRAGAVGPPGISSELACWRDGRWTPVFRSLQPTWTVTGLEPGRCRVSFPSRFDEDGQVRRLDEKSRKVRVRAGEVTEVDATLRHVSKPLVVAGVAAGVVAAVLLHDWLDDLDLPTPEPPWWLADVAVQVAIDLAVAGPHTVAGPYGPGPVVSGHHPAAGGVVEPGHVEVVFSLAQPVDLERLDSGGVTVTDRHGHRVSGYLQYDADQWWLVWRADEPLPGDETFHVTLAADALHDVHGRTLPRPTTFTFHTR